MRGRSCARRARSKRSTARATGTTRTSGDIGSWGGWSPRTSTIIPPTRATTRGPRRPEWLPLFVLSPARAVEPAFDHGTLRKDWVRNVINPKARPCDEAAIRAVQSAKNCAAKQKSWVLVATILGSSIAFIDESVVNVALPAIEADLSASVEVIQ